MTQRIERMQQALWTSRYVLPLDEAIALKRQTPRTRNDRTYMAVDTD